MNAQHNFYRALIALFSTLFATAPLWADPVLTVSDLGLNASLNREWLIQITPDANLFTNTVNGVGGSVAVELGLEVTGSDLLTATVNAANFPFETAGNDPFTSGVSIGTNLSLANDTLFAAYGSDFFTTGDPVDFMTLETAGSGTTTVSWGGHEFDFGGIPESYIGSRLAQELINFDGVMGSLTAGDGGGLLCDFNGDDACTTADIDLMFAEGPINNGVTVTAGVNDQFDLDSDGDIDLDDRNQWLGVAATENGLGSPYRLGDANLDGVVDVSDFNIWNSNKFQSVLDWSKANFNGDAAIDVSDFNLWNGNKFTSSDAAAVPEPATMLPLLLASMLLMGLRRSR
ncbi:MAG: PEP-CTERM sorting domain-containing protein [Planctomycetota bacterium]